MKEELEKKLVEKFPVIFRNYCGDFTKTCMHWGVETGDGWFDLLEKGVSALQHLCDLCRKDGRTVEIVADQIKEKFGTLRFYYSIYGANDTETRIIHSIVDSMERESEVTCENNGTRGELCVKNMWYKTLSYEEARKNEFIPIKENVKKHWGSIDKKRNERNN